MSNGDSLDCLVLSSDVGLHTYNSIVWATDKRNSGLRSAWSTQQLEGFPWEYTKTLLYSLSREQGYWL